MASHVPLQEGDEVPPEIARLAEAAARAEQAFVRKYQAKSGFVSDADAEQFFGESDFIPDAEADAFFAPPADERLSYEATDDPYSRGLAASLEESGFGPGDPAIVAAAPLAAGAAMALGPAGVVSLAKAAAHSVVGAGLGAHAGRYVGSGLGAPEAGENIGRVVGGITGVRSPKTLVDLAKAGWHGGGLGPWLLSLLGLGAKSATALEVQLAKQAAQLAKQGTFRSADEALAFLRTLNPEQLAAVAEQAGTGAARAAAPAVASAAAPTAARETARQAGIAMAAAPAAEVAAPTGVAATAARGRAVFEFAAEAARNNPKLGSKIWFLKDAAGNPVRVLTPDQAAAAKRAGESVSWIKNLWQ
jgi:hypothetical protein